MSTEEAKEYHLPHIKALREGGADFVSALTLTYPEEAIGVIEASRCVDNSTTLDIGNPHELGRQIAELRKRNPSLKVLGGCCGTDIRHIRQICDVIT